MISIKTVIKYCKDYQLIENYEVAVNDKTQSWDCHHRNEILENKSAKQLKEEGLYYDVNPDELIFLTKAEHNRLHNKGKQHSTEAKQKMSLHHKGKQHSTEAKQKMSLHHKGKQHSTETKQKMSENHRGGSPKKSVQCIETAEVFESLHSAARHYNLFHSSICQCCNGKRKSCGGFHWKFI